MTKFITPIILIGVAIAMFFLFTNPIYHSMANLKTQISAYDTALDNAKALGNERDKVVAKKNSMNTDDLNRLQKLLPDNVNNIRLILEIEQMAVPYGMTLKDIKYNVADTKDGSQTGVTTRSTIASSVAESKDYGTFNLEFSTMGTYDNFIAFTKDLESNLRIVDIDSINFSSNNLAVSGKGVSAKTNAPEIYKYDFKIKTYWLKN